MRRKHAVLRRRDWRRIAVKAGIATVRLGHDGARGKDRQHDRECYQAWMHGEETRSGGGGSFWRCRWPREAALSRAGFCRRR